MNLYILTKNEKKNRGYMNDEKQNAHNNRKEFVMRIHYTQQNHGIF